ncbi:MAG TPA: PIN domain-containing protein [Solirubrobacterales bacterium]|nr:PIN domain-containing protein [Solirubrobacterales bacterium]
MTLVLADTSAWARISQARVAGLIADANDAGALLMTGPLAIELLRVARNGNEFRRLRRLYGSLDFIPLSEAISRRARDVLAGLAERGWHRGPSVTDLLIAAAAERAGATVWHHDKHFEQIAEITGQPVERIGK